MSLAMVGVGAAWLGGRLLGCALGALTFWLIVRNHRRQEWPT